MLEFTAYKPPVTLLACGTGGREPTAACINPV